MNHLIEASSASQGAVTMSSREIAELVGSRHDKVKQSIERLASVQFNDDGSVKREAVIVQPPAGDEQSTDAMGRARTTQIYLFTGAQGKRDSLVVVAQLCPEFTASLVDRWQELEDQVSRQHVTIPQSLPDALRLAADLAEKNEVLQIANQQQSEKITSLESLFKEGMTVTQFCKGLNGVNVMAVNEYLLRRNWLYNESTTSTRWRAASYARDRYLTEHQNEITLHGQDPFIKFTPVLLKRGAVRLHELYLAGELPMKKSWDGQFTHDKASRRAA